MDGQPALGTVFFHVVLLAIIVLLVDERLIRGGLAIIPGMFLAQRAMGATAAEAISDWSPINDRRMNEHVREHIERLLSHFRDFYALSHHMTSGRMSPEEAGERAGELENDLNRLLDEVTAGPPGTEKTGPPQATPTPAPVEAPELTAT